MPEKPKFCLDTNSFAEPARRFYPFDFASSYWDWFASLGETAWISVLEVYEEILEGEGEDSLKRWVRQNKHFFQMQRECPFIGGYSHHLNLSFNHYFSYSHNILCISPGS